MVKLSQTFVSISRNFDTDSLRHSESLIFDFRRSLTFLNKINYLQFHVLNDRTDWLQSTVLYVLLAIIGHYFPTFKLVCFENHCRRLCQGAVSPFLEPKDFLMLKETSWPCLLNDSGAGLEHLGEIFSWLINFSAAMICWGHVFLVNMNNLMLISN